MTDRERVEHLERALAIVLASIKDKPLSEYIRTILEIGKRQ